jgi:peptide methionine sulfoxide reductase MsrA
VIRYNKKATKGHVEPVQVEFEPNEVSYEDLVDVFWSIHNPTTKNRKVWGIGSQYRSLIDIILLELAMDQSDNASS